MIVCDKCGQHLDATEVDEYTPDYFDGGLAIRYEHLPIGKDEIHLWKENGNLLMHFVEDDSQ